MPSRLSTEEVYNDTANLSSVPQLSQSDRLIYNDEQPSNDGSKGLPPEEMIKNV